jgi:hypothetical protein
MAAAPENAAWRAMAAHGFASLSPPEAEHAILELPTNRAEYVAVLEDIGEYPARSPIGQRVPSDSEVATLRKQPGRWRAVVSLEDERALANAASLFQRVFVLDPFYETGALLYAAWHDPLISDEHSRRLAEQAGLLVRASSLLSHGTAVLVPDHLPGSWNPRPGWRRPRSSEDQRQLAAWAMRRGLVLLYWADRLDALICATRSEVIASLDVILGLRVLSATLELSEPRHVDEALVARSDRAAYFAEMWADARVVSRRRMRYSMEDVAFVLAGAPTSGRRSGWRVSLGEATIPDPAMLLRRVLNGQDPEREPPLPRRRLKRRPLCLIGS